MKEFLSYLVTNVAKNPMDVNVEEVVDGNTYVYNISVNPDDMGLVIGKSGRIINSIRALAKSKAIKEGIMINVNLLEPEEVEAGEATEEVETEEVEAGEATEEVETEEVEAETEEEIEVEVEETEAEEEIE